MTPAGRTSWWPCDAAEHSRELTVELGQEFGAPGPLMLRVLKDLAQQQRDEGTVRTGFRSLARDLYIEADRTREIVEYAASIGAVDDLTVDPDGRRFTCRLSGWTADQARGRAAIKKADQRSGDEPGTTGDTVPKKGDKVPVAGDVSGSVPPTRDEMTLEVGDDGDAGEVCPSGFVMNSQASALHPDLQTVVGIFRAAKNVDVDEAVLNSACFACHDDVIACAHLGASWAMSGSMSIRDAGRLLGVASDSRAKKAAQLDGIRAAAEKAGAPVPRTALAVVPDDDPEAAARLANLRAYRIKAEQAAEAARITKEGAA